jgi:HicB family
VPPGPARRRGPCAGGAIGAGLRISVVAEGLAKDLEALGALGDETTANAARLLAAAMQGPITAKLLEVLGQLAVELGESLPEQTVEVRLVGDDAELVVAKAGTTEPDLEGDADARITLRLSAQLKARIEAASARDGVSVNTYIVRSLSQQARSERAVKIGRRLSGYGHS